MEDKSDDMKRLFEPKSVLVVGASREETKIGYKVIRNMVYAGYNGLVFPVNPKGGEVLGYPIYTSIDEIEVGDEGIDMGIIIVPAKFVYQAIESCARKKVKHNLIISSGFSEIGNNKEETRIVRFARENGMRVLGPNMFGIYSRNAPINCTFGVKDVNPGEVAIITQSGAIGLSMMGRTVVENIGLSAIAAVGNKADLDEADLLQYLMYDDNTRVVLMYIEGIKNGDRFVEALEGTTKVKPVIIIKSGRSKRGAMAAASHTGSLAGEDNVFDDIMRQCGVLRADTINEALSWCKFISHNPLPRGENSVIVTNGGGVGVLCTDACEKYNIQLYDDAQTLREVFTPVTPELGSVKNPIDITGQAMSGAYSEALDAALSCDGIDTVFALYCEKEGFSEQEFSKMIKDNYDKFQKTDKVISFSIFGGEVVDHCLKGLGKMKIPVYGDVYDAVSPVGAVYSYYRYLKNCGGVKVDIDLNFDSIDKIVADVKKQDRFFLLAHEAQKIMNIAGIKIPETRIASSLKDAVQSAEEIGYPVVMKVVSKDIIHKSDAGGIALDLINESEVADAYEAIMKNCRAKVPNALIEGVEVAEMVQEGTEFIVGAKIDKSFGPIVMVGLGGIYVEVMKDVAFRAFPLKQKDVVSMIQQIRSYPLLLGVRGEERKDIEALVDSIIKLGSIIYRCHGISDIEVNPVLVYEQGMGVKALDVRILLSRD